MLKRVLFCFFIFGSSLAYGQSGLGLRAGLSLDKELLADLELKVNAQLRYADNITYLQGYLGELGLAYKINKHFDVEAYYRYYNKRKNEEKDWKVRHRYYGEVSYDQKIGAAKFKNRLRYQHQFKDTEGEIGFDTSYLRNKLEFNFQNKTALTPYISADFFYQLSGQGFDLVRTKLGGQYKLSKHQSFDLGIFKDSPLNGASSNQNWVLTANYKFKF